MKLDRELQKEILKYLFDQYVNKNDTRGGVLEKKFGEHTAAQLLYLHAHDLIKGKIIDVQDTTSKPIIFGSYTEGYRSVDQVRITEKGLDFIQQDGGLSAILDKVTFKLDEEQFNDILTLAVDQSTIPTDQKPALKKALETAGHSTITTLISKGIDSLATTAPDLLTLLAKAI